MQVLYVHGMGRTPLSGAIMMHAFKKAGLHPKYFAYSVSFESFESIVQRLKLKITQLSNKGPYITIGHSLGGVLLRAALNSLPESLHPQQAFLLSSPILPSSLAIRFKDKALYKLITQDCGQLLASHQRMAKIGPMPVRTTAIIGTKNFILTKDFFAGKTNDGIVSEEEISAHWISQKIYFPILHSWLPQSKQVAKAIMGELFLPS